MPRTHTQILLHIVFATKDRHPWLTANITERLYAYIGGIIRSEGGQLWSIGGIEDHIHLYICWRQDKTLSDLMRNVKSKSSGWLHKSFPALHDFEWQEGYSAFSVSKSQEAVVKRYVENQVEKHRKIDGRAELIALLKAHGIAVDERYPVE